MTTDELQLLAIQAAVTAGLDPALICAICANESGFEQYAVRYEPAFYVRYIENMVGLSATEKTMRATSFGLMQIMGQVAREQGFDGKYLTELFDPETNLYRGCKKFKSCLDRENGDVNAALLRYNGGGNPGYPALVLAHYSTYEHFKTET